MYASTRAEELAQTGWPDELKAEFCRMQFEAQDAHYRTYYPNARFTVIVRGGEQMGRLYVDRWEKEIRVMDIALLPSCRGRGAGTFLLKELQTEARDAGKVLSIHVERFNPALLWYQRLGFQVVEEKNVYLLLNWNPS
ncbi:GNAT family N-acetyltransferase [Luteolibacter ambystomatis]|uniref:GNAT family N-acetyltransferase n=1 Tax=Luteolibacter ambystomatis TaxID=2824561 RepID=A0A975J163_9BACT|nr:GNAT family N-acetyltransferase [Luteolibacter ambystomatis]QUE52128.1 GNAT family N-acetyltransferase [Luteolibacter ambystomatis]